MTPAASAAVRTSWASAALAANGFSDSTCLPAAMAARFQRAVQGVGQRVVDDVDLGIGQHLGVGAQSALDAVARGVLLRAPGVAGGDGDEPVARRLRRGDDGLFGDPGRTEDADPQR